MTVLADWLLKTGRRDSSLESIAVSSKPRILVLAGIGDARDLCKRLASKGQFEVFASLAGRVADPKPYPAILRTGGFGDAKGLAKFLHAEKISLLVDCTHPFAVGISRNACTAIQMTGIPLARFERPPWIPRLNDQWLEFPDLERAIEALPGNSTVFAPLGKGKAHSLVTRCALKDARIHLIIRTIVPVKMDPVPANVRFVAVRPPYSRAQDRKLFQESRVTCLLCRNSGADIGRIKLDAAADLKLPVHMISQPDPLPLPPASASFTEIGALETWIYSHRTGDSRLN